MLFSERLKASGKRSYFDGFDHSLGWFVTPGAIQPSSYVVRALFWIGLVRFNPGIRLGHSNWFGPRPFLSLSSTTLPLTLWNVSPPTIKIKERTVQETYVDDSLNATPVRPHQRADHSSFLTEMVRLQAELWELLMRCSGLPRWITSDWWDI